MILELSHQQSPPHLAVLNLGMLVEVVPILDTLLEGVLNLDSPQLDEELNLSNLLEVVSNLYCLLEVVPIVGTFLEVVLNLDNPQLDEELNLFSLL